MGSKYFDPATRDARIAEAQKTAAERKAKRRGLVDANIELVDNNPVSPNLYNRALDKNQERDVLQLYCMEEYSIRKLSKLFDVDHCVIERILNKFKVRTNIEHSRRKIAAALPRAADNVVTAIEEGNVDVSLRVLDRAGAIGEAQNGQQNNQQSGGVTINLAVFDPRRAGELLKDLASDNRPPVVDAELHEDDGRAGQGQPVQALPEESVL